MVEIEEGCVNELAITQPVTIYCGPPKPSLVANNSGCVLQCQPPHPFVPLARGERIKKHLTTIKEQQLRSLHPLRNWEQSVRGGR